MVEFGAMDKLTSNEALALQDFRSGRLVSGSLTDSSHATRSVLAIALEATAMQRSPAFVADTLERSKKTADTSDVTQADKEIERFVRDSLLKTFPDSGFDGEETEPASGRDGSLFAVDPIDGTTSFLHFEHRSGLSLAKINEHGVEFGLVSHASVGEVAYAEGAQQTRVIQAGLRPSEDAVRTLPVSDLPAKPAPLLQVNNSRTAMRDKMFQARSDKKIIRPHVLLGSPAVGLLDAARGKKTLVLEWMGGRPTEPYDLLAGFKLVLNASGTVLKNHVSSDGLKHETPTVIDDDSVLSPVNDRDVIIASASSRAAHAMHEILR